MIIIEFNVGIISGALIGFSNLLGEVPQKINKAYEL